jgi:hypothetical protein
MKTLLALFVFPLVFSGLAIAQTTVVEETFSYADGLLDTVGTGGTGWDATEGGWQTGNSVPAENRFEVVSGQALYQGGGVGVLTEQNRTFAAPLTASAAETIAVSFTLLRPEAQAGRGIGIYLTNAGANLFFIGKEINDGVGLKAGMGANSDNYAEFADSGAAEPITVSITYDGTNTSIVLSDSNETLPAYTVAGALTFDGISVAGYNGATTTNGIDDISVTTTANPDPWLEVEAQVLLAGNGAATDYSIPIRNLGATADLTLSVAATGTDAADVSNLSVPATLGPLASGAIDFTFTPSLGAGFYSFDLEITSNDASEASPRIVNVEIEVAEPLIAVDTGTLDFGALPNNPGPQTATFKVTNNGGTLDLYVTGFNIAGQGAEAFTVTSPATIPFTLTPGASQDVEVTFGPGTRPGEFSSTLTIQSNDANGDTPVVELIASTDLSANLIATYTFGTAAPLDLASSDAAIGSTAGDLVETDAGVRTEFGLRLINGNGKVPTRINGNAFGWSRREAPNNGLDLAVDPPTEALAFTLTPAPNHTIDFSTDGWLTVDVGAFSIIGGPTAYDCALMVDDGTNPPVVLGPVAAASVPGANLEDTTMLVFDVRSLGTVTAPVTFTLLPQSTGNTNGVLGQAGGYFDNITLSGEEIAPGGPNLVVTSPAVLVDEGLGGPFSIPIENLGTAQLDIASVATDGSGAASTISNITFTTPLAANGGAGTIDFDFAPDAGPGLYTTNLVVVSNDPNSPTTVALEITVRDPEIALAADAVNFGVLPNNPGPQTLSLTVFNDGEVEPLVISGTTLTGASEFAVISTPGPIAPGDSGDIEITFTPGAATGRLTATLAIQSNDSDGTEPEVVLTGFVAPPGTVVALFDFDPDQTAGSVVDADGSGGADWNTGDLIDRATGTGALAQDNQLAANRALAAAIGGDNYLAFSSTARATPRRRCCPAATTNRPGPPSPWPRNPAAGKSTSPAAPPSSKPTPTPSSSAPPPPTGRSTTRPTAASPGFRSAPPPAQVWTPPEPRAPCRFPGTSPRSESAPPRFPSSWTPSPPPPPTAPSPSAAPDSTTSSSPPRRSPRAPADSIPGPPPTASPPTRTATPTTTKSKTSSNTRWT